jgi:hypothetical protein
MHLYLLGDVLSGLPFPAQPVPDDPEQGEGNCWGIPSLHVVKKGSDVCIHNMLLAELKLPAQTLKIASRNVA